MLLASTLVAQVSATVLFGGDVVAHRDVLDSVEAHGHASLLGPLAPLLARAALTIVNLESPVVTSRPASGPNTLRFNGTGAFLDGLSRAGVDAVSLANNHGFDQGPEGVAATISALRARGLAVLGASDGAQDPHAATVFTVLGRRLCVVAATRILNFDVPRWRAGRPGLALALPDAPDEETRLVAAVTAEARRCGAVVVTLHTGTEYEDAPEARDRRFFRRLADAGAAAVIGHHSHTPQPVERYAVAGRDVPLFYSLGNLVSAQGSVAERAPLSAHEPWQIERDPRTREGLLAVLQFEPEGPSGLRLARSGWLPLWTSNDRDRARREGLAATLSAAAMPWGGGGSPAQQARWRSLVSRVGPASLFAPEGLAGAEALWPQARPQGATATLSPRR
ncbi:MAG: CapA family protein [Myxococcales bacterium]|nr:CapA family protein [Myxococcales bacterium]